MFAFIIKIFASSFSLGPLLLFIINIIDIRVDALRLLWIFRRPVGYKAENIGLNCLQTIRTTFKIKHCGYIFETFKIGSWFYIIRFINVISIINNSFLIAFTSHWADTFFGDNYKNRYIFVVVFEVNENFFL